MKPERRLKTGTSAKVTTAKWWLDKALWHLNWPAPQTPPVPRKAPKRPR